MILWGSWRLFGQTAGWSEAWSIEQRNSTKDFFEECYIKDKWSQTIHQLHLSFGYRSKWATGEGPKENSKNNKILKKDMAERKKLLNWVKSGGLGGTLHKWMLKTQYLILLLYKGLEWKVLNCFKLPWQRGWDWQVWLQRVGFNWTSGDLLSIIQVKHRHVLS